MILFNRDKEFETFYNLLQGVGFSDFLGILKLLDVKMFESQGDSTPKQMSKAEIEAMKARDNSDIVLDCLRAFDQAPKKRRRAIIKLLRDSKKG